MDINLQGKSALVCGSSQGIGKACAIELANLGANVTLFSRNQTALEQVKSELNTEQGQKHQVLVADFSQPEQVKEVINTHVNALGGYDILINNTGGPAPGPANVAGVDEFINAFNLLVIKCN